MKTAVLIAVLTAFLVQKTSAVCRPVVMSQKGFRLDTSTDIYVNFHDCQDVVTVGATLATLPGRNDNHDQIQKPNIHHQKKPVKITLMAKSDKLEEHNGRIVYRADLRISYCDGQNCGGQMKHIPPMEVVLNKTHGYVFLTTKRPAYRPGEKVDIFIALTEQNLKIGQPREVTIHIKTPNDKGRISVDSKDVRVVEGFGDHSYDVPSDPMLGVWWIEAYVDDVKMAEKSFLIDRYVLPTFQVKIKPKKYFILPTDQNIRGELTAEYSYGEKVSGSYYMSFRLKRADGTEQEFHKIPRHYNFQARIQQGTREYSVPIDKLKGILKPGESLESFADDGEANIVIMASVTGKVESVFESDYVDNIIFARSPYVVDYSRSAKFYLPRTVYELKMTVKDVVFHLPLPDIQVKIKVTSKVGDEDYETDENGKVYHEIDSFAADREVITIETGADKFKTIIPVHKQQMNRQLLLRLSKRVAEVGDRLNIRFALGNAAPKNIRFSVVSRGEIVYAESKILEGQQGGEVSDTFEVTAAMVPHARVVAYYVLGNTVTSQSVFFDVVNECENDLKVTPVEDQVKPGSVVGINVEGAPNSQFFLKAVDRAAYFVHNGTRLNRDVLWREMAEYDTACSVQGGRNSKNVFEEAGLSFNGIDIDGSFRSMFCVPESRKKRSAPEVQVVVGNTATREQCEKAGALPRYDVPCEKRIRLLRKNLQQQGKTDENIEECVEWFQAKCSSRRANSYLARSAAEANGRAEENRAQRRSDFAENWFARENDIGESGERTLNVESRHSITIFDIDGFGMSRQAPMCIAKTTSIKVFQNIFIQLYLPYSVRVGEQAQIRFSVFNYGDEDISDVEIKVKLSEELCSKFGSNDFKLLQILDVPGKSVGQPSTFSIMPLKIPEGGKATIEIKAGGYDHIAKKLLVEEPGLHNDSDHTLLLEPDEENPDRIVPAEDIVFDIPKTGVIPNSKKCWLYAYSHPMGPNIQLDEFDQELANVGNLVRQPGGCGEQNMIYSGPTIFVHEYRFAVWGDEVTQAQTNQAIASIKASYNQELTHLSNPVQRKAFAVWSSHMPSTWLNAFVVKVFSAGRKIWHGMDTGPLCSSLNWMMNQQQNDGQFNSGHRVHHQEMIGQVKDPISLAAYVSISLVESKETCPHLSTRILAASNRAMAYVKGNKAQAQSNTYTLAMGAYALSIIDPSSNAAREWNTLLRRKKRNEGKYVYWHGNKGIASHIEVTGYALLAEVSLNGVNEENDLLTRNTAYWLISKRNANGGFRSTQDTVVALQALAKYMTVLETSAGKKPPQTDISVTVKAKSKDCIWHDTREPLTFHLGVEHTNHRKEIDVPPATIADGAQVWVSGVGMGTLTYRCSWRQYAEDGKCNFNIDVSVEDDPDGAENIKILKVFVSKPKEPKARMSIIDVGLLTGFIPNENSLKKLCTDEVVDGAADRYEITLNTVKFYLSDIDSEGVHLNFKIEEVSPCLDRQPASVSAYEYYEPDIRCTKFYSLGGDHKIQTSCQKPEGEQKEICKCSEGACPVCRTWEQQLTDTICSNYGSTERKCKKAKLCAKPLGLGCYNIHTDSCPKDYVYVIEVKNVGNDDAPQYKYFTATVLEVFRQSSSHHDAKGSVVKFLMRQDCFDNCRDDDRYQQIAREKSKKSGINVEPEHYIAEGHVLMVFDTKPPYKDGDSYVYELGEEGHLEATLPSEKCNCPPGNLACEKKLKKKRKGDICLIKSALRASHSRGCDQ